MAIISDLRVATILKVGLDAGYFEPSSKPHRCMSRLKVLGKYLKAGAVGAEIGVFKGAFANYLLSTAPSKLYLVDPWYRLEREWSWAQGARSTARAACNVFRAYEKDIDSGRVEPRVEFSHEFFQSVPDAYLDWIYLDSSHEYEHTLQELEFAVRKVKRNGFILGDDWNADPAHMHYGVCRAATEMEQAGKLKLLMRGEQLQFAATPC